MIFWLYYMSSFYCSFYPFIRWMPVFLSLSSKDYPNMFDGEVQILGPFGTLC